MRKRAKRSWPGNGRPHVNDGFTVLLWRLAAVAWGPGAPATLRMLRVVVAMALALHFCAVLCEVTFRTRPFKVGLVNASVDIWYVPDAQKEYWHAYEAFEFRWLVQPFEGGSIEYEASAVAYHVQCSLPMLSGLAVALFISIAAWHVRARVRRRQCHWCGYALIGLKGDVCPECGVTQRG